MVFHFCSHGKRRLLSVLSQGIQTVLILCRALRSYHLFSVISALVFLSEVLPSVVVCVIKHVVGMQELFMVNYTSKSEVSCSGSA